MYKYSSTRECLRYRPIQFLSHWGRRYRGKMEGRITMCRTNSNKYNLKTVENMDNILRNQNHHFDEYVQNSFYQISELCIKIALNIVPMITEPLPTWQVCSGVCLRYELTRFRKAHVVTVEDVL